MISKPFAIPLVFMLAAGLLGAGVPNGAISAQEDSPQPPIAEVTNPRLMYDGIFNAPHLLPVGDATTGEASPALLPAQYTTWSRLVFQSARNGHDWEVYAAAGDGSDQANLSNHSSIDIHPRLNRGATRVVFASNRQGNYEIFAMNPDGGGQSQLTYSAKDDVEPAWSLDGSRIAFQSYRDGQAEIYVMQADGDKQTRLTSHGDYDGEPAWSPDGAQIAFVRRFKNKYRIWVMNSDGSNAHQLSNQPSSENPAWSPDGSQIAYDADGNGDGWQELWLMDAAGSNQRQLYDPPQPYTDAWAGGWSPDGRYVAFTRISFVQQDGNWYWTTAYLDAWDAQNTSNTLRLSSNGEDWNPDWQANDFQAPSSSVQPLPTESPGPILVRWSGTDAGPAGIASYDIQAREGADVAWADWQMETELTAAAYPGYGGHTYYFRARARDYAGNVEAWRAGYDAVTTVEALPPQTSVETLPPYSREGILVRWRGHDPGGSGIQSYDVKVSELYGDGDGGIIWRTGITGTSVWFNSYPGEAYGFTVRGKDNAGNLEDWSSKDVEAASVIHNWAIVGQVTDNRGMPVMHMEPWTEPGTIHGRGSDETGAYYSYVAKQAPLYIVTWRKAGYLELPATAFPSHQDVNVHVVMPPADNVVQNWGFESGGSSWQFTGSLPGRATNSEKHSGASAAFLGSDLHRLGAVTTLTDQAGSSFADSAIDDADVIHSIWIGPDGHVMYSSKPSSGPWTVPAPLADPVGDQPRLLVDRAGTVHVLWLSDTTPRGLYYSRRQPGAGWSAPERIPGTDRATGKAGLAEGADGVVKVAWAGEVYGPYGTTYAQYFTRRDPSGAWTSPQELSPDDTVPWTRIATDPAGRAHVLWYYKDNNTNYNIVYTAETADGSWFPAMYLSQSTFGVHDAAMLIDNQGTVHIAWTSDEGVYYRQRRSDGPWSSTESFLMESRGGTSISMVVDRLGRVHLAWNAPWSVYQLRYALRSDGAWSLPVGIAPPSNAFPCDAPLTIAVSDDLTVHVLWAEWVPSIGVSSIRYSEKGSQGGWSPPIDIDRAGFSPEAPQLLLDDSGKPHALWVSWMPENKAVRYAATAPAPTGGEASLSQVVQIPAAALAPTLSFMHRFDTEFPSNSRLEVMIDDGISATTVFSTSTGTVVWAHHWVDLRPWAGRSASLRFRLVEAAGGPPARAYIDEVTVGAAAPDLWVSPVLGAALPGAERTLVITYGNRGAMTTSNTRVTLQVPFEMSFVTADPPPTALSPELRWDVGDLAAEGAPRTIRLILRASPSVDIGRRMIGLLKIASDTAEPEQLNNTGAVIIYAGRQFYLPVIAR